MAVQKSKKPELVEIKPLEIKTVEIKLVGDTPFIMHKWSHKAKEEMLATQTNATKTKARDPKVPMRDFVDSMYWISGEPNWDEAGNDEEKIMSMFYEAIRNGARFGFPTVAIKKAAMSSAYRLGWIDNQMALRGSFFLIQDYDSLAEVCYDEAPCPREDMVKVGMGTADIRYRGEFKKWHINAKIQYNASGKYSLDQIVNFINAGGFCCGIGEWRPERDGDFGRFHVEAISN